MPAEGTPPAKAAGAAMRPLHPALEAFDGLLGLHAAIEQRLANEEALTAEDREAIRRYEEGLQKMLDIIAPAGMEVRAKDLLINDRLARTLFAYNWPNYIYPNWLSQAINLNASFDIAQYIYPASNKAIMKMLRKKVAELRSSIRMLEQRGIVRDPVLEAALQDAEELRDLLARGQEKLYQFGMYVTLYAEDEKRLKKIETDMESILGGKLVLTKPAMFQMEHGWTSSLPLCLDELEINRNMNTSPIATSFPFSSADLTDDHGILYGINRHNDSLVIFDRFDLPNANANIFATSGAGKSFTAKLEILRSLMLGTDVFVIDPENEYTNLCEAIGGSFIPLSIQSPFRINPFDLPKAVRGEEAATGEILRSAVINLHGLLRLMLGPITPSEDGILDKAILDTYALSGITLETPDPSGMEPPTLGQLVDVLMTTEGGENMARTLQKYTAGSFAGLFDKKTNVELDKQMVVFQIRDLEEQLRPIAVYVALNFLWNRIRAELKKRLLVIDEAWNLMQYEDSARFLYGIVKRARKYYLGVTTITQDIDDFVESPYGKPVITNSSLQFLLKQSPATVDGLQKLFYLTDGEKYFLLNSDVGQGILFAGYKHVAVQIIASPEESALITTKPEEVLAQQQAASDAAANVTPPPAAPSPEDSTAQPPTAPPA
ncbi:MAG: Type IV secretory pathway VirB4 components-like protein [Candidatus Peregrinibacteria bacterium Gr01-1014_25]|nr:MAG: Type IV secretory pathway VirB4 components-like protein [Candidatus Peregrinibacteria bacterium Gr01-1014_25]